MYPVVYYPEDSRSHSMNGDSISNPPLPEAKACVWSSQSGSLIVPNDTTILHIRLVEFLLILESILRFKVAYSIDF